MESPVFNPCHENFWECLLEGCFRNNFVWIIGEVKKSEFIGEEWTHCEKCGEIEWEYRECREIMKRSIIDAVEFSIWYALVNYFYNNRFKYLLYRDKFVLTRVIFIVFSKYFLRFYKQVIIIQRSKFNNSEYSRTFRLKQLIKGNFNFHCNVNNFKTKFATRLTNH